MRSISQAGNATYAVNDFYEPKKAWGWVTRTKAAKETLEEAIQWGIYSCERPRYAREFYMNLVKAECGIEQALYRLKQARVQMNSAARSVPGNFPRSLRARVYRDMHAFRLVARRALALLYEADAAVTVPNTRRSSAPGVRYRLPVWFVALAVDRAEKALAEMEGIG